MNVTAFGVLRAVVVVATLALLVALLRTLVFFFVPGT
jgi:hypothetical protein